MINEKVGPCYIFGYLNDFSAGPHLWDKLALIGELLVIIGFSSDYIYSLLLPNLVLFIADPPTDGRCQLSTRGITLVRWADSGKRSKKGFASVSASIAVAVVFGFDSTDSCWSASNLVLLLLVMCNLEYHLSINILYFRGIKGMNLSSYKFDP